MMKKIIVCLLIGLCLLTGAACADTVEVLGLTVEDTAQVLDFDAAGIDVTDADALAAAIDHLPALTEVRMYDSTMTLPDMERLFDAYPQVFFGFTLHLQVHHIRTDVTAFSTLHYASPTKEDSFHTSEELSMLRMCRNLKALDLGHNYLTDLSFLQWLPDL